MTVPLSRNRDYNVLWSTQVLSEVGFSATTIALPLLVLALTGSPGTAGLVLGVNAAAQLVAGLPAGALVDRWNRKRVMLACEVVQGLAIGSLAATLLWDVVSVTQLVVVAVVIGVCRALFEPAEDACLPKLVPDDQLATAVAMNSARSAFGHLSGTALGGFLFAMGRLVPFAADALTHFVAFVGLTFLRVPPRRVEQKPMRLLGAEMTTGLRWVWQQRAIRVTAQCALVLNLFFNAFYIIIIVLAKERGVPAGEIGVMAAMLGAGGLLGALAAPRLLRVLSPYASIVGVFWTLSLLSPVALVIGNGYLMGALFAAMAFLTPTANTTINTYQLLATPDELRGRLSGVMGVVTGTASALGPALGGFLMEVLTGGQAVLLCTAGMAVVTVLISANSALRRFSRDLAGQESLTGQQIVEPSVDSS
jgi:MFS family permease